jgi:hypothetical protein
VKTERALKRGLAPLTTPSARRWLIARRNAAASAAAGLRGSRRRARLKPMFIVAGAQKAGTTYLYQELVRHPQVIPAMTKELHYFSDGYRNGPDWYRGFFPTAARLSRLGPVITGEASPSYLFHPWFPARVARDLPDAKIIIMLRDPVKRAFSHYLHERRLAFEPASSFAEALALEGDRVAGPLERLAADPSYVDKSVWHFTYRRRGHYLEQLERLHEHVDRDNVLVIISEEFYADIAGTYQGVCSALGLAAWRPTAFGRNDMAAPPTMIDEESRQQLIEYFAPLNAALETYLGRSLPWSRP